MIIKIDQKKSWFVYILECKNGTYYTGITNGIDNRMKVHASGKGSKYVARNGFSHLLIKKKCKDKSNACRLEYKVKQLPKCDKLNFLKNI